MLVAASLHVALTGITTFTRPLAAPQRVSEETKKTWRQTGEFDKLLGGVKIFIIL